MKNEDIFAQAEGKEEIQTKLDTPVVEEATKADLGKPISDEEAIALVNAANGDEELDLIDKDFTPKLSSESKKEKTERFGQRVKANGRILTIKDVTVLAPKTYKLENGEKVAIEPATTKSGAQYYSAKLQVKFVEDNLIEYYPNIKVWVNDGVLSPDISFYKKGYSRVSWIVKLVMQKLSGGAFELEKKNINERATIMPTDATAKKFDAYCQLVNDQEIMDFMIGKKVRIETSEGDYNGPWFRNDIVEFLD